MMDLPTICLAIISTPGTIGPGWRNLKVKVDKKDIEVRARKGFFVTNATIRAEMTRNSDMSYALSSPIEGTGVSVTMKWVGVSGEGDKKKATFVIRLPPDSVSLVGRDQNRINFEFGLAAYRDNSKDGKPVLTQAKTMNVIISPEQLATYTPRALASQMMSISLLANIMCA